MGPLHIEACDDGNDIDSDGCSNSCTLPSSGCGNGIVELGEECDDGLANNDDDRDCRSDCVINRCGDGRVNSRGTHHEDCDGAPRAEDHARTAIPIGTGDSAQMALSITNAVNGVGFRIDATQIGSTGIVSLTNRQPSAVGNTPINNAVTAPSFFVSPAFTGGHAGDCANATQCVVDADCRSNHCDQVSHTCTACTSNSMCASGLCSVTIGQCLVCTHDFECGAGRRCNNGTCQ